MEGPGDDDLVWGYKVRAQGGVNKQVSDNDWLRFKVTGELEREQNGGEGYNKVIVGTLDNEMVWIVAFARGFFFPFMLSKGQHLW